MVMMKPGSAPRRPPRLGRLHDVQEQIYRQLQLLLPDSVALHDRFLSEVDGALPLCIDVLERHPYTQFLRVCYAYAEAGQGDAPRAHLRVYDDVRMAEVTSFNADQGTHRSAHPWYPNLALFRRTWRQNLAMDRWLGYLLSEGHSVETMMPLEEDEPPARESRRKVG